MTPYQIANMMRLYHKIGSQCKLVVLLIALLFPALAYASEREEYVASGSGAITVMLNLARVGPGDVVYDLGSGDGRIVIAAAKRGARAVGIEIDSKWVAFSRQVIADERLVTRASIVEGDFFKVPFDKATVVAFFLGYKIANELSPKLKQLPKGTRIVSNGNNLKGWKAERVITGQVQCNADGHCFPAPIFLWVIK